MSITDYLVKKEKIGNSFLLTFNQDKTSFESVYDNDDASFRINFPGNHANLYSQGFHPSFVKRELVELNRPDISETHWSFIDELELVFKLIIQREKDTNLFVNSNITVKPKFYSGLLFYMNIIDEDQALAAQLCFEGKDQEYFNLTTENPNAHGLDWPFNWLI